VRVQELAEGDTIELGGTTITPIRLAEDYVYAFLFEGDGVRVLIAMDELNGWMPTDLGRLDLAYLPWCSSPRPRRPPPRDLLCPQ